MLFHLETNSKFGKIYLPAIMKYTWRAYLSPPFTVINYYSNFITILLSFQSLKLSRFCFFLITRLHITFTIIIFFLFCFCFKWLVQVINLNLLKKNRRCKVIHNEIQRKFLLQNFCLGLLSYSILYHILHFSVHKTFFTFMNARILSLKAKQFIWFNVVHISHFLNIPATPQRL